MKNRFCKFLVMLMTVIAVGTAATMLNLTIQEKATGDKVSFTPYVMNELPYIPDEIVKEDAYGEREMQITNAFPEFEAVSEKKELSDTLSNSERQAYYSRLQDMEAAYEARIKAASKEPLTIQQTTAGELLEIWDDELNSIYQKLRNTLSEEDFIVLRDEERAWIRNRDEAANRAAARDNYSNNVQNLAYTHTLLEWTKERVYELAEMYYRE